MTELPQAFLSQMAAQLKGEMAAFLRTYDEPYQRGLRVNPWKRPTLLPDDCGERVPWEENGHYLALTSTAGADVLHEAGAWYLQEPSAMLPAAVLNYLLLLGWAPEGEQEIFSLDEMIKIWDPARISKSPAIFDPLKLRAINAAYIRALPAEEFRHLADPFIDSAVHCSIDRDLLCANLQPRCEVLEDIPPQLDFFDAVLPIDAEMYRNKKQKTTPESAKEALTALLPVLEAQTDWTRDAIFEACKTLAESMEKKNGWLLFPLGIALSGKSRTPGGGTDLAAMMGKEETVKRVKAALEKL